MRDPSPPYVEGIYHPAYKVKGYPWFFIPLTDTIGSSVLVGIDHTCDVSGGWWEKLPDSIKGMRK